MNVITQQFMETKGLHRTHFIQNHLDNNPRLLRLFGVACYRLIPERYRWKACDNAVNVSELLADGLTTERERAKASNAIQMERGKNVNLGRAAITASSLIAYPATFAYLCLFLNDYARIIEKDFIESVGEILTYMKGNWDNSWNTSDVTSLAKTIYDKKQYSLMPILSDALQEAGCQEKEILEYCQKGPFLRGCWVLDKATCKR